MDEEHPGERPEEEPREVANTAGDSHLVSNGADDEIGRKNEEVIQCGPQHGPDLVVFDGDDAVQKSHDTYLKFRNEE